MTNVKLKAVLLKDDVEHKTKIIYEKDLDYDSVSILEPLVFGQVKIPSLYLSIAEYLNNLLPTISSLLSILIPQLAVTDMNELLTILRTLTQTQRCQIVNDVDMGAGC